MRAAFEIALLVFCAVIPVQASSFGGREAGTTIITVFTAALFVFTLVLRYKRWQTFRQTQKTFVSQLDAPIQGVPEQRRAQPIRRHFGRNKKETESNKRGSLGAHMDASRRRSMELQQIHGHPTISSSQHMPAPPGEADRASQ